MNDQPPSQPFNPTELVSLPSYATDIQQGMLPCDEEIMEEDQQQQVHRNMVVHEPCMNEMEEIFFSGTFGGELLSLAASKEVLQEIKSGKVIQELTEIGSQIRLKVNQVISKNNLQDILQLVGHDSWVFLNWSIEDEILRAQVKTYFMQEMFQEGILVLGTHNVSTAIRKKEIRKIERAYYVVLGKLAKALSEGNLESKLKVEPPKPLFRIR